MAVTKQNYTVSASFGGWTSSQLADAFRDAFIDAGLMTSWHDSFTTQVTVSGITETIQHRVLRIIIVPGKRYGTIYHWFVFRASGSTEYAFAHQWDIATHQPTGVAGLDFFRRSYTRIEVGGNSHRRFGTHVTSTTTTLTRYTSGIRSSFSMFLLKGGNNYFAFFFIPANSVFQPFVDLDLNTCGGLMIPTVPPDQSSSTSLPSRKGISFNHLPLLRSNIFNYGYAPRPSNMGGGGANNDNDFVEAYGYVGLGYSATGIAYAGFGASSNPLPYEQWGTQGAELVQDLNTGGLTNKPQNYDPPKFEIALPAERSNTNLYRSSDSTPVFSDLPYSIYLLDRMPIDFGIVWHYTNSTMEVQDVFQVTPGLEEWEILAHSNRAGTNGPSPLILARII